MEQIYFGKKIAALRKAQGLTQEGLAQRLGITNQAVSKWESDLCCPDIMQLPALAEVFGIRIDALFGREEPETVLPSLPWEDDGSLRAVCYVGRKLVSYKDIPSVSGTRSSYPFSCFGFPKGFPGQTEQVVLEYTGNVENIVSDFSVRCIGSIRGNASAGSDLECQDIGGNATCGGDLTCKGNIAGDTGVGSNLKVSGSIGGNVTADGDIECAGIGGSVSCGGDLNCQGNIQGDTEVSGDLEINGDLCGSVNVEGDLVCKGSIRGNATAEGDIKCCGTIGGNAYAEGDISTGSILGTSASGWEEQ